MAHVHGARVRETSTTTGTGTYNLAGAVTGFETFVAGIGTGNTCFYTAEDGTNWEEGIGTVTDASPDTLARTVILSSSNADAAVSWGAGTRNIFCSPTPNRFPYGQTITPAQLVADANDYNPTGLPTASILRISGDASNRSITGIAGGVDGRVLILYNEDANNVYLPNENAGSAAANRITLPIGATSYLLAADMGVVLLYDGTTSRWRPLTTFTLQAEQAAMEAASNSALFVSPFFQTYHPTAVKAWGEFLANSTTIETSHNIASVADTATGAMTVTIATDFSSLDWCCQVTRAEDDLTLVYSATYDAKAAGTVIIRSAVEAGSGSDPTAASGNASWSMLGLGDFA